ncbi:MAG: helix-turn-helix domain-containing protein [Imperialibacter sp.]|uniref:helix-turn-helix domain-containing protein n=1 Tax=Imperialibacter sp. TaxID=2038411 RepID=UPI0032ED45D3
MATEVITTDDLREFKIELLEDLKRLLKEHSGQPSKKWLKSYEVRKLLSISPGTLQNLRVNGTLPFTKIGGVIYYDYADIQGMLQSNKFHNRLK